MITYCLTTSSGGELSCGSTQEAADRRESWTWRSSCLARPRHENTLVDVCMSCM